jgi:hypothetical protein
VHEGGHEQRFYPNTPVRQTLRIAGRARLSRAGLAVVLAVVGVDEEVSVNPKVLGKKVEDLRYEATVLPQD